MMMWKKSGTEEKERKGGEATWPSPPLKRSYFFLALPAFFAGFFAAFFVAMSAPPPSSPKMDVTVGWIYQSSGAE